MEELNQTITEDLESTVETLEDPIAEQPRRFPYSNFMLRCSCGNIETLEKAVQEGVMHYDIPTMEGATLSLQCPSCLTSLDLYFEETEAPKIDMNEILEGTDEDGLLIDNSNEQEKEIENEQVPQEGKVQE